MPTMTMTDQAVQRKRPGTVSEDQIQRFLEHLGQALSTGDLAEISRCWEVPALVLSDEESVLVSSQEHIETFFAEAVQWYRSQGLMSTRPRIERVEALTERLASVDVRWPAFDEAGMEKTSERSHYILRRGDDGQLRIRVALTRETQP